jgi:hypothetical protein
MTSPIANPGTALAEELCRHSEQDAAVTPWTRWRMPARESKPSDDQCFRLLGRLLNNRFHSVRS